MYINTIFLFVAAVTFSSQGVAQSCESTRLNNISSFQAYCASQVVGGCGGNLPVGSIIEPSPSYPGGLLVHCYYDASCMPGGTLVKWTHALITPCDSKYNSLPAGKVFYHKPKKLCGSVVSLEDQTLGEKIPVVGTPFSLNYFSHWSQGRVADYVVEVPVSGATPRDSIDSFDFIIKQGSTTIHSSNVLNNIANSTFQFVWNGMDNLGSPTLGSVKLDLEVIENHGATPISIKKQVNAGGFKSKLIGLGGWLPSIYAFYDTSSKQLFLGDGSIRNVTGMAYGSGQTLVAAESGSVAYIFDSSGRVVEIKSGFIGASIYTFAYDSSGRLLSISEPFGRVTSFDRNFVGDIISITAPKGQVTSLSFNGNGMLESVENPNNEEHQLTYDSSLGLLETFTKPGGQVSTFSYDAKGLLIKDEHSGGYFFDLVRNLSSSYPLAISSSTVMGRITSITSNDNGESGSKTLSHPNGSYETYTYGVNSESFYIQGLSSSTSYLDDLRFAGTSRYTSYQSNQYGSGYPSTSTSRSYTLSNSADPFSISAWTSTSSMSGTSTSLSTVYSPIDNSFTTTSALGKTFKVIIDAYERLSSVQVGTITPVQFSYTNENMTGIAQGGKNLSIVYSSLTGWISSITDTLGNTTSFAYDDAGRVIAKIFHDLRVIGFSYDSNGNLTGITPPGRPLHSFLTNGHEELGSYVAPSLVGVSSSTTSYSYNLDKQLTSITRPSGGTATFSYGSTTGLLDSVTVPSGQYQIWNQWMNRMPDQIKTPEGISTWFGYIGSNVISVSNYHSISGISLGGYSITLSTVGLVSTDQLSYQTGNSYINYLYNNDRDLTKSGDLDITYSTPNGGLTGTSIGTSPAIVTDAYSYNSDGEIIGYSASYNGSPIYSSTLIRDTSGRTSGKIQTMNGVTDSYEYTFDSSGRLTATEKNTVNVANYGYDSNSNRNSGNVGSQATTASYDDQDRAIAYNTLNFTYNSNGEMLTKTNSLISTTTSYTYDVFGNLMTVTLPSADVITYEYDGLMRRIGKKLNGVVQARWIYMDQYRIAGELNASGALTKRFVYGSKGNIPDYMIMGGENYRIISDHLGSPRLVVKVSDGSVLQMMDHDEFGRVIADTNPGATPFGFAGGLYDTATQLVHFGARDYDPEVGRWTSKDPILFNGGDTNLFGYVQNDPINWTDSTGLIRDPRAIFDEALNHPDSSSGTNGIGNAFQHCFASCMMAGENGSATAAALGAGFEFINNLQGQKSDAYCMDTHNNQVGRDLARENGISNLTGISEASHQGVSSACAKACTGANSSGRLVNLGGR